MAGTEKNQMNDIEIIFVAVTLGFSVGLIAFMISYSGIKEK
jgi:hypothetical protein